MFRLRYALLNMTATENQEPTIVNRNLLTYAIRRAALSFDDFKRTFWVLLSPFSECFFDTYYENFRWLCSRYGIFAVKDKKRNATYSDFSGFHNVLIS